MQACARFAASWLARYAEQLAQTDTERVAGVERRATPRIRACMPAVATTGAESLSVCHDDVRSAFLEYARQCYGGQMSLPPCTYAMLPPHACDRETRHMRVALLVCAAFASHALLFPVDLARWTGCVITTMMESSSSWGMCCSGACMAQTLHSTAVTQLHQLLFVVGSVFCRCC
ncbi:hypothetical protein JKP88DRAFT_242420 [Tribonema minus]|uniref:Uncharacterized protein n=1 Tax=Tribonema minus TaxID=303371 RepID=A0A835YS72_9STRA|nr:hypothetical protein JKP88DRAFT_242420 [Tribonema minus]